PAEALQERLTNLSDQEITFQSILDTHKGKKILIDVWASWCGDCIAGLPDLKKLQKETPEVMYVFLSLDKNVNSWKKGIDHFQIEGDHYFMKAGKKGGLGDFLGLWWIPRYIVVSEKGEITLFKATKITDKKILEAFKK
ncbi:MAG: TlpA family protein disulfide reductase, partial [Flavobacteriaceae bacterium]|nr:TlpA family protein disulfide reductase [Flavobacteriaceae bacterium]